MIASRSRSGDSSGAASATFVSPSTALRTLIAGVMIPSP